MHHVIKVSSCVIDIKMLVFDIPIRGNTRVILQKYPPI